ncbi:hypothetical protein J6590_038370 [Homalodisca vitripennis]|nr:hypothetical protein J6590_038370 [Homalodisca vitripennis]
MGSYCLFILRRATRDIQCQVRLRQPVLLRLVLMLDTTAALSNFDCYRLIFNASASHFTDWRPDNTAIFLFRLI